MWDLIVSVPDHCLSFYFLYTYTPMTYFIMAVHKLLFCSDQRPNLVWFRTGLANYPFVDVN